MTVAVSQARRIGASAVSCASTGNTSASLAAYAALAGIPAIVLVPAGQVALGKLAQTLAYGARTLLVRGDFDDCLRLAREASERLGVYLANSINPFRIAGQMTIVFELLQQLGWRAPDWIVLPAGNLGNTAAFGAALRLARDGTIRRGERVVAVLTGHILKDPGILLDYHKKGGAALANPPIEIDAELGAVERVLADSSLSTGAR